jgi:hypothetical protein
MKNRIGISFILVVGASFANAQIPDLLNALDAGSRSMGAGSAFLTTSADTFSILNNPAGLGYISTRSVGLAYRNLPTTQTSLFGSVANPTRISDPDSGSDRITHLGYAVPLKDGRTFGFSYQVGGYVNDLRSGTGLTSGGFNNVTYTENVRAKIDYFTFALGKASSDGSKSFGYGITFANLGVSNRQFGFNAGQQNQLLFDTDVTGSGIGVGLVGGIQFVPKGQPNSTVGISLRTPINVGGGGSAADAFKTIPGQFSAGMTTRIDNLRGSQDYLIYGAQISHFFGGSASSIFDRNNQTVLGLGGELNLIKGDYTLPVRLGYMFVPSGGDGFGSRNALTFGFGYRPNGKPWGVDLNYVLPRGASKDFALNLTYRFEK